MHDFQPRVRTKKGRVSLNWTQLNAIIDGVSAIDLGSLAIRNMDEAREFAIEYGFNVDDPIEKERILEAHHEAIAFIEEYFLEPHQYRMIPEDIRNPRNVLDLLVFSSHYLNKADLKQLWACAVLKVMHGIFHIDHDFKLKYFDVIRSQIFESIDKMIISKGSNHYLTDGKLTIPLFFYEKKRNKGRKSILMKLLQKPTYVASDIYDHLGIRFIFETKAECLFALKIMRKSHLLTVTNIKPFRSRNNLLDIAESKRIFSRFRPILEHSDTYPLDTFKRMDEELDASYVKKHRGDNPHSSADYQVIQVTARKMIHVPNPAYAKIQSLLHYVSNQGATEIPHHFADEAELDKEFSLYFDYEIQLLDRKSYLNALRGPASHAAYKQRQRKAARKRVLGPLIKHVGGRTREEEPEEEPLG